MRRREFIALFGGAAASFPIHARAEREHASRKRIGAMIIYPETNPNARKAKRVFEQSLQQRGWMIGQNLAIDYRWGIADLQAANTAAVGLLALNPDLLFANSVSAARAAKQATSTVPIVFNAVSEPIGLGLVPSLSHPGSNITGFTNLEPSIGSKWLQLLRTMAPQTNHAAVMFNPNSTAIAPQFLTAASAAGPRFGVRVEAAPVREVSDINTALQDVGMPGGALITLPDTFLSLHGNAVIAAALSYGVPAIYPFQWYVEAGGLMSYGPDLFDEIRSAVGYIDRIFRGARPADLPVQEPTKFDFVINEGTARKLGLAVPDTLLAVADEVIE